MNLNTIVPKKGSSKNSKRLGRGVGSGHGKTCGRGHKGQHSRSGGYHKVGFEGGQMPIARRLPKRGFSSKKKSDWAEIKLNSINKMDVVISIDELKKIGLVQRKTKFVKIISPCTVKNKLSLKNIFLSEKAKKAVISAGGNIEE